MVKKQQWLAVLSLLPLCSVATMYRAPINGSEWNLELSRFECRMWQPIPIYGDAVFQYRAGEKQRFYLAPARRLMKEGRASLVSQSPVWDESRNSVDLGEVAVTAGTHPVQLRAKQAVRLLDELNAGMSPVFSYQAWFAETGNVQVGLSSIKFRKAYQQYRTCLVSLLPVNFDQIARSRLRFPPAQSDLTAEARRRLDTIVNYVKADSSVTSFFVDGHTDDLGRRLANLDISKKRAEAVTKYLVASGIDEKMITTRYHGERYPVVKNKDRASREKNRRVTVRLARDTL